MKRGIIALLSVLALVLTFTGCSESDGAYTAPVGDGVSAPATTEVDIKATTFTNEFGINPDLGTPPPLPAS